MENLFVLGISVSHRMNVSEQIQHILTSNGCKINARIGLPLQEVNSCSDKGLIIIQLICSEEEAGKVKSELNTLEGVKADLMVL